MIEPTVPKQIHSAKFVVYNPALTNKGCKTTLVLRSDSSRPVPVNASLLTKAGRLRQELTVWLKKGAKLVPSDVRRARVAVCLACDFYRPSGNFGLGECGHPSCGCVTKAKAALATSVCPALPPRWPAYPPPAK